MSHLKLWRVSRSSIPEAFGDSLSVLVVHRLKTRVRVNEGAGREWNIENPVVIPALGS